MKGGEYQGGDGLVDESMNCFFIAYKSGFLWGRVESQSGEVSTKAGMD